MERIQECSSLQEQRDQCLGHLQQYSAGYQQLISEREHLHKQFLHQTQLMDRLQHDEVQGKTQLEQSQLELQQAQVSHASAISFLSFKSYTTRAGLVDSSVLFKTTDLK